jgi:RES domain-containing protein
MILYRGVKSKYAEKYDGMGNSYQKGARWNHPYFPVLYFAPTSSVAALELANYFPSPKLVPSSYVMGVYELPDSVSSKTLELKDMPEDWTAYPHPTSTKDIGSAWLRANKELCLFVPSSASPGGRDRIVVVNPIHPEIKYFKLIETINEIYNKRTFQGLL